MRPAEPGLDLVLAGTHSVTFLAHTFADWDRPTLGGRPLSLTGGGISHDMTQAVCGSGDASVAFSDTWGRAITPKRLEDALSPFGNWVRITASVTAGRYRSDTVVGWFEVSKPTPGASSEVVIGGVSRTLGETFKITFDDAFLGTQREPIVGVVQSPLGGSILGEVGFLAGLPVSETADGTINSLFEYPEDRLDAILKLAAPLGTPYMRWDRTIGIRPEAWPEPSAAVAEGRAGVLSDVRLAEWDSTRVYNRVVVVSEREDQDPIESSAQITSGRLRYGPRMEGCWGQYTLVEKVPGLANHGDAQAHAEARLATVSQTRVLGISWEQPYDPRMEVGDVYLVSSEAFTGPARIRETSVSIGSGTMKVGAYRG